MGKFLKLTVTGIWPNWPTPAQGRTKAKPGRTPHPLLKELRELTLRKCARNKEKEIRAIFERQPFGELERLVTQ